jgi:hypothetical protein
MPRSIAFTIRSEVQPQSRRWPAGGMDGGSSSSWPISPSLPRAGWAPLAVALVRRIDAVESEINELPAGPRLAHRSQHDDGMSGGRLWCDLGLWAQWAEQLPSDHRLEYFWNRELHAAGLARSALSNLLQLHASSRSRRQCNSLFRWCHHDRHTAGPVGELKSGLLASEGWVGGRTARRSRLAGHP